jgi:hypothetical protein
MKVFRLVYSVRLQNSSKRFFAALLVLSIADWADSREKRRPSRQTKLLSPPLTTSYPNYASAAGAPHIGLQAMAGEAFISWSPTPPQSKIEQIAE